MKKGKKGSITRQKKIQILKTYAKKRISKDLRKQNEIVSHFPFSILCSLNINLRKTILKEEET